MRDYISAHLDADLGVARLATLAGMSASCFARWFRAQMGISPHAFVLEARLARARRLLRETDKPLIEVALAAGFSNQVCMNVTFRRCEGVTPGRFRALASRKAKDVRRRDSQDSRQPAPTGGPA